MENNYTTAQVLTAGKDLVAMLIEKCNAANNISGFLKEYLSNLTDDEGIYRQQQVAMDAFAKASAEIESEADTMISSTRENGQKIQEICNEFSGLTTTILDIQRGQQVIDGNVANLNGKIKEISDFIQNIQDVSEQTNLLSFNASIEAARAGNAGKGFRIIANEVKALSDRTTKLASDIGAKVRELQSEMASIVAENQKRNAFMASLQRIATDSSDRLARINEASSASVQFTENVLEQVSTAQKSIIEATGQTEKQNIEQARRIADRAALSTIDTGDQLSFLFELQALFDWFSANGNSATA